MLNICGKPASFEMLNSFENSFEMATRPKISLDEEKIHLRVDGVTEEKGEKYYKY